jgi:hypothetical protein
MTRMNTQKVARIFTITLSALLAVVLAAATAAPAFGQAHGTWTKGPNMGYPQQRHNDSATLLQNGQVLVAGGFDPAFEEVYPTAELYNPSTGVWTQTGRMTTPRWHHTATLLKNGEVLVTGGSSDEDLARTLDTAELYNPSTGTWTATGSMTVARHNHSAVLLEDGEVLVAGGDTPPPPGSLTGPPTNAAELYNPSTGTFTATGSLNYARAEAQLTLLQNGEALIAGGGDGDDDASCTAELFSNGQWRLTANLVECAAATFAALLTNGDVLVNRGGATAATEFYDPSTNVWQATLGPPSGFTFALEPLASLANGKVLVTATVGSGTNTEPAAALYDPSTNEWTPTGSPIFGATQTLTRLLNGQLLGTQGAGTELYTP